MTKADLIESLRTRIPGLNQSEAAALVDDVLGIVKDSLSHGEEVKLTGFGIFDVRSKSTRTGRNPQTGEPLTIEARRVVRYRPSDLLKARMNERPS